MNKPDKIIVIEDEQLALDVKTTHQLSYKEDNYFKLKSLQNLPRPKRYIRNRNLPSTNSKDRGYILGRGINKTTGETQTFTEFTDSKGNKFKRKANGQIVKIV